MANTNYAQLSKQPLLMASNRVWRTYSGGQLIEAWQGKSSPADGDFPEEWIASTVIANNIGREHITEGLSLVVNEQHNSLTLQELITANPAEFLGQRHAAKYASSMAVLVKVIDAAERLTIQVHPDRPFAKAAFGSEFGKTEAWYILGGRPSEDGQPPALYMGFKPGVTREQWRRFFEEQDIAGMLGALHRITPQPGEVYLIEGGLPHAIGSGCFLLEIQEPTDLTLRTERVTPRGRPVSDAACHQNLGFARMLQAFHYENYTYDELIDKCRLQPQPLHESSDAALHRLIGEHATDRFRMDKLQVTGSYEFDKPDIFTIAVVLSGRGSLSCGGQTMPLHASQQWFLPAGVRHMTFTAAQESDPLQLVLCYPPSS